jgi:hypothetical protein
MKAKLGKEAPGNNYIVVVFDSCRYDSFFAAQPKNISKLGEVEARWSYASWTAPSHYNLLSGLVPHTSPKRVFASQCYKNDFQKYAERLGIQGVGFRSLIPKLYFPAFLQESLHYRTHAMVSLPVLNPRTILNNGFDTYRLMEKHNDMRAMVGNALPGDRRHSTANRRDHYPYALPDEPPEEWPRISRRSRRLQAPRRSDRRRQARQRGDKFFNKAKMKMLRDRQIKAVKHLDVVVEELFDLVPRNTYITITSDHGELFGESGFFGHGPIMHKKVFEVPFVEGKLR